jgi:DNA-binding MarR family transcriptional regulator
MENKTSKYGEVNEVNLKLVVAVHRTIQKDVKSLSARLAEYELTLSQFGVLEALYHKGPMKICEIIEKTLSTSGNMTVVIKNLERGGYVTRERDDEDRRAFVIKLKEKGRVIIADVFPKHLNDLNEAFSKLDFEEKHQLLSLLKKLNGV